MAVRRQAGLVLTHGAGADLNAPLLIAVAGAFERHGWVVERVNLAFREKRPKGPPFPAQAAEDRAGLWTAVEAMRARVNGPVVLGGHSYGGRQASMLLAEEPGTAAALVLLSYPLHPPNKPAQLRTTHFSNLRAPALFVHGEKDPFGTVEEMRAAIAMIPASTELRTVAGAGHDLKRGKFAMDEMLQRLERLMS